MTETETAGSEARVALVDALRGYALMGLFMVHMSELFELYWAHPEESAVRDLVFGMFAGKAYALFALCFGFSFHVMMHRAAARGTDFSGRFVWRLALLALIGWLHGLVYRGDIVVVLAALGLLLVPFNRIRDNRPLAGAAALCFLLPFPLLRLAAGLAGAAWANQPPHHWSDPAMDAYVAGGLADLFAANLWAGQATKWWFYIETGRLTQIFGLFLAGLVLGRIGFFAAPERFARARSWAFAAALAAGLALSLGGAALVEAAGFTEAQAMPRAALESLLASYRDLAWTAVSVLVLVALWQGAGRVLLALLVPAGRITLTLYVGQSLLFVPVFYNFGLGLHDDLGQAQVIALGAAAFAAQLLAAAWWVRRFRHGPLEWAWRAGTYPGRRMPFRRGAA